MHSARIDMASADKLIVAGGETQPFMRGQQSAHPQSYPILHDRCRQRCEGAIKSPSSSNS